MTDIISIDENLQIFKDVPDSYQMTRDIVEELHGNVDYLVEFSNVIIRHRCSGKTKDETYKILDDLNYETNTIRQLMIRTKSKYEEHEYFKEARVVIDIYTIGIKQAYKIYDFYYTGKF